MKPTDAGLVGEWIARAKESLAEARALVSADHLIGAVNRIYYACFYAVTALLHSEGLGSSKHSGAMALFDLHFVRPHRVPTELGRFYHQLFDRRQRGDYTILVSYDRADVADWLRQAEGFVEAIAALLQT